MSEQATQTSTEQQVTTTQQPDNSTFNAMADALWNDKPAQSQQAAPIVDNAQSVNNPTTGTTTTTEPEGEVLDINDWLKREFEIDNVDGFKNEWNELRKLKEKPAPEPPKTLKWNEFLTPEKEDEIFQYVDRKKQLDRLEKYDISDVSQASEIIKANLQFKYKDLSPQQIDRLYSRQYAIPEKPVQNLESDDEYAQVIANWQRQVQDKEQDIMIDAKIAKPELVNYKSQLSQPDISNLNNKVEQQGPSQEDLAAQEAFHKSFVQKLGTDYVNFKGYNTIAKDGEVELPINYGLTDEEKLAFNPTVQKAVTDINNFLDNDLGWWDKATNSFNINKIQEDLYLLLNRDKVFSKFAGDAAAKRYDHHLQLQNNIKLNGVNSQTTIPTGEVKDEKTQFKQLADTMWNM